jgi:hypothetical protein
MKPRAYQSNAGLTFTSPQIEMKDHPARLRETCGLHLSPSAVLAFQTNITPKNQLLHKFLTLFGWHRRALPGIKPRIASLTLRHSFGHMGKIQDIKGFILI